VIEHVGFHRPQRANVVGDLGQMWHTFRQRLAAFAVLGEFSVGPQQLRITLDKRKPLVGDERLRDHLPIQFLQLRLRLKHLKLARPASHEQKNHALGPRRKVSRPRSERIGCRAVGNALCGVPFGRSRIVNIQQRSQRHRPNAHTTLLEKMPASGYQPGLRVAGVEVRHRLHSRVIVSSKFNKTRQILVQAISR
jgi:hypothetical protein